MTDQTPAPAGNLYGAVDLSGLARQADAGGPGEAVPGAPGASGPGGAEPGAAIPGPYAVTLTERTLQGVMETSAQVPVVIVVTSARAQGSEQLADDLTDLAREAQGRYQVARVDADTETGLASALGVQAIPSVLLLLAGRPIPVFQGTADKEQLRSVVQQILSAAAQSGVTGSVDGTGDAEGEQAEPEAPVDPNMQAGMDAIDAGDLDAAERHFEKATIEDPRGAEPRAALAQVRLMRRAGTDDPDATLAAAADAPASDVDAQLAAADVEIATGRMAEGLERVLGVVQATAGEDKVRARVRLVELFDVVGQHHPAVADVRRRLASSLY